jgi:hypothetical protein
MSLLTVVQDVCAVVGVAVPTSVYASINGNRTMQEMVALATEMAQTIAYDTRDWTRLRVIPPSPLFVGDGVQHLQPPAGDGLLVGTSAFNLPADYKRMLLTSEVWRSNQTSMPMRFVPDTNEWLHRRLMNIVDGRGEWTIMGGKMNIWPIMLGPIAASPGPPATPAIPAVTATMAYLQKNCIALTSGGYGDRFMNDNDTFLLDERTLKLGMIWRWKANKGSPYAEDMGTYSDALVNVLGKDSPAPIIVGRTPVSVNAQVAYPWPVPT